MQPEPGTESKQPELKEWVAGRYQLTRRIARGGMGEVFAAIDRSSGQAIALKRLNQSARAHSGVRAHFMREFHALSELRHPRIIAVYDYGVEHDMPYYTMELLDGQDLRDLSPLPYREACLYLRDVASSLALLHARRLLHRDVSPRNVRRVSDGHCKLLDFGAMIPFGVPPNVTGTAPCVPPEALQGASLDQRSDLYALGALAYCVLTGRHAHDVTKFEELPEAWEKPLKRPSQRAPDVPEALDELVMSLLSLDSTKRPKSAAEVIDWLSAIGQLAPDDAGSVAAARSFMTSSRLCGRERPSAELGKRVQRTAAGSGSTIMVEGRVGTGKSRILNEAALLAQTCGLSVVRAAARPQRGAGQLLAHDLIAGLLHIAPLEAESAGATHIDWGRVRETPDPAPEANGGEVRARLQQSLNDVFCRVARVRPLLLTIDDVEQADELSLALLASLARQTAELPLMLVCSRSLERKEQEFAASLTLRSLARPLRLADLSEEHSQQLVESIFGNGPNIDRLTAWMYRTARGNPRLIVELSEHLMQRELVSYVGGTWILPANDIAESVPVDLAQTWRLRLEGLSPSAIALAELLAIRRGGASAELCLAAAQGMIADVFSALDELVQRGVLESAGDEYAFAQLALRDTLAQNLDGDRSRQLHAHWADVLLKRPDPGIDAQLEAGWHMLHGGEALRGADLLALVALPLVEHGMAMETAIPALEKALAVYEANDRPLETCLRVRSMLVLAGYLFDYKLAARYGERTLDELYRVSGMALAARIGRFIGPHLAFLIAFALTWLLRWFKPAKLRGPSGYVAILYFVRSAMGVLGVSALALDAPRVAQILKLLAPFRGAPGFTSGRLIYLAARAFATQGMGREGELRRQLRAALRELTRGRHADITPHEYRNLQVGLLLADGVQESMREGARALEQADALAALNGPLAQAAAERVRMLYHLRRGDFERAEQSRKLIDVAAIQGGTTWQVEWFSLPMEASCGAIWSDLLMVRRALERLERLSGEITGLAPHLQSARTSYHFRRGEYAEAVLYGERFAQAHPPRTLIGWGFTYGMLAFALLELNHTARARELCEFGVSQLTPADRAYFWMYSALELAYATVLALAGQRERADAIVNAHIARRRELEEYGELVATYQHVARMAKLIGDRVLLTETLAAMREAALKSGLPTVILLADRISEAHTHTPASPAPQKPDDTTSAIERHRHEGISGSRSGVQDQTTAGTFLKRYRSGTERNREALRMLARWVASEEAYMFVPSEIGLKLTAAVGTREAPEALLESVARALRAPRTAAANIMQVEIAVPGESGELQTRHYRIVGLPAEGVQDGWAGAVALHDASAAPELPMSLLEDVGKLLARGDSLTPSTERF